MPITIKTSAALAAIALFSLSATAMAQTTMAQTTTQNGTAPGGVTSGPASGTPATLGTGGVTTATPHQTDVTRNHAGAAVSGAQTGQRGGTQSSVRPGQSDAGAGVHQTTNQQQQH